MAGNFIKNIAIVGAGGRCGTFITEALLQKGTFNISAITRPDSTNTVPNGVQVKKVDYDNKDSLAGALKGVDALIITMAVTAPGEQQGKLIEAAAEAGVPYVLPNEWGYDFEGEVSAGKDVFLFDRLDAARKHILRLGKSAYIAVNCGFWYQYSLLPPLCYGFDIKNRAVTFINDGNVRLDTSTWPQVGRAVANLLSLKTHPDNAQDTSPTLEQFKNKHVRFNSFNLSQKDMFAALLKASNTKESDWNISHENGEERYNRGLKMMQGGDRIGFALLLYTRMFYKEEPGCMARHGLHNDTLGLPKEDLMEATKEAVVLGEAGKTLY